jgi:hypothetical protein
MCCPPKIVSEEDLCSVDQFLISVSFPLLLRIQRIPYGRSLFVAAAAAGLVFLEPPSG